MSRSTEIAALFDTVADLLELRGELRFKPAAYRRAARSLESLGEEVDRIAARGGLDAIPGVGPALAEKIREYLRTGTIGYYEELRRQFPAGVLELLALPGIGPKTARRFLTEFAVGSPEALRDALDAGRLDGQAGFGAKRIEALRSALAARSPGAGAPARIPILAAFELAERIVAELARRPLALAYLGAAGSLRRGRETIGDIDLLAATADPAPVFAAFSALPGVREIRLRGPTKETVLFEPGIQIDLRVVPPESVGAALQYFTGSKEHNIRIRAIARERGLKINEYGVYRGTTAFPARSEEEVYGALGLPWIPPELREDRGEIEAARAGALPPLLRPEELRGDLHLPAAAAAPGTAGDWEAAARRWGLGYLGFVATDPTELPTARGASPTASGTRAAPVRWLPGLEIGPSAIGEPIPRGIAFRVLRAGPGAPPEPAGWPARSADPPLFLTHLPPPSDPLREAWIRWALSAGIGLEVTGDPGGEGLDSGEVRRVVAAHGTIGVSSRADRPGELGRLGLAARLARRGWAEAPAVVNARPPPTATAGTPGRASRRPSGPAAAPPLPVERDIH